MKIIAAHYLYLLSNDQDAIKKIWDHWCESFAISQTTHLPLLSSGEEESTPRILLSSQNKNITVHLSTFENLVIIETFISSSSEEFEPDWKKSFVFLEKQASKLEPFLENLLGETICLIGSNKYKEHLLSIIKDIFPTQRFLRTDLKVGAFFAPEDYESKHLYALISSVDEVTDFLCKDLPTIDASVFKILKEIDYFENQIATAASERQEIDKEITDLLHQQVVTGSVKPQSAKILEKEIGRLSKMYGILANDSLMINQAHTTLDMQIRALGRRLESLLSESAEWKDLVTLYPSRLKHHLTKLSIEKEHFNHSLDNVKAAIDVVQTRASLLRSSESLMLQKQTKGILDQNVILQHEAISLQTAAVFLEFILVFFYSLESWKILVEERIKKVPVFAQFGLTFAFAMSIVVCTHFAAKAIQHRKRRAIIKFILALLTSIGIVCSMGLITYL